MPEFNVHPPDDVSNKTESNQATMRRFVKNKIMLDSAVNIVSIVIKPSGNNKIVMTPQQYRQLQIDLQKLIGVPYSDISFTYTQKEDEQTIQTKEAGAAPEPNLPDGNVYAAEHDPTNP